MSTIQDERDREETREDDEGEDTFQLPSRPRRRFLNPLSAGLLALLTAGAGFFVGVVIEKGKFPQTSSAAASFAGATAARGAGGTTGTRAGGAAAGGARGGGAGGFAAGGFGGASIGTISSVDGSTLAITETSGNVVKVTLSSATAITKNLNVHKSSLHPGDTVVVRGATNKDGSISATAVTDSGASAASAGGGAGASGGSGGSARSAGSGGGNSAVNSLFGSGGG